MKIYIIPAWYPQNINDITACFFREQAHALADRGHDVTVIHIEPISVKHIFKQRKHNIRTWQDDNVRTIYHKIIIPIPAKLGKAQENYISNTYYGVIKQQIDDDIKNGREKPEIIHAHVSHSCGYYCLKAKEKLHIPLVVTEHYSGLLLGTASELEYQRVKETIEKSDAFIFVGSNFQKSICERLNINKKTYFIPNMINTSDYSIKSKKNDTFTILTACHLKKNKSVDLVIKAFHQAFEKTEQVKLVIAGDGEEREALQELINDLDENNRISMFGRYTKGQSEDLFSNADLFVLTSKVETFGIVYIEALACGVPCIGTKGQGAEDIIDETNGYLVEYGNIEELSHRIMNIYKKHYDRKRIRTNCLDLFGKDTICCKLEKLYDCLR